MKKARELFQDVSLKIIVIYCLISFVWVFVTELSLSILNLSAHIWIDILKGSFFIAVTSFLLFKLIRNNIKRVEDREQQLHTLIDSMPDFVSFKDEKGRWIKANKFGLQIFDLENIPFQGRTDAELADYTKSYREPLLNCITSDELVWKEGKTVRCEEIIPQPNRENKVFDTIKVPLFHTNGKRKGLVIIGRDITDRKKIEKQLEESEQLYRSLFDNNTDAVCTLDLNGSILSINHATESITGYSEADLISKSFYELLVEEDRDKVRKHFDEVIKGNSSVTEVKVMHKQGHYIMLSVKDVPIIKDNNIKEFFVIARDITELKQNEEFILKSEKLSIVGELATAVAHEIRNPLTSLKGFLHLLKTDDEMNRRYYEIMGSELDRINSIVSEFMILSKPHATQYRKKDIHSLLNNVITLLQTLAIMKNIKIKTIFESNLPQITCEENQLKQVFINILKNAIEAVDESGKIEVEAKVVGNNKVLIKVTDNGSGIPKELLPKLGEPFYTTKEKGTGLGLMVSHKIIQEHNGSIEITSKENEGTNVKVILPLSI